MAWRIANPEAVVQQLGLSNSGFDTQRFVGASLAAQSAQEFVASLKPVKGYIEDSLKKRAALGAQEFLTVADSLHALESELMQQKEAGRTLNALLSSITSVQFPLSEAKLARAQRVNVMTRIESLLKEKEEDTEHLACLELSQQHSLATLVQQKRWQEASGVFLQGRSHCVRARLMALQFIASVDVLQYCHRLSSVFFSSVKHVVQDFFRTFADTKGARVKSGLVRWVFSELLALSGDITSRLSSVDYVTCVQGLQIIFYNCTRAEIAIGVPLSVSLQESLLEDIEERTRRQCADWEKDIKRFVMKERPERREWKSPIPLFPIREKGENTGQESRQTKTMTVSDSVVQLHLILEKFLKCCLLVSHRSLVYTQETCVVNLVKAYLSSLKEFVSSVSSSDTQCFCTLESALVATGVFLPAALESLKSFYRLKSMFIIHSEIQELSTADIDIITVFSNVKAQYITKERIAIPISEDKSMEGLTKGDCVSRSMIKLILYLNGVKRELIRLTPLKSKIYLQILTKAFASVMSEEKVWRSRSERAKTLKEFAEKDLGLNVNEVGQVFIDIEFYIHCCSNRYLLGEEPTNMLRALQATLVQSVCRQYPEEMKGKTYEAIYKEISERARANVLNTSRSDSVLFQAIQELSIW